jgi:hypothetical protein
MSISKEAKKLLRTAKDLKDMQVEAAKTKIYAAMDPKVQELIEEELLKELNFEEEISDDELEEKINLEDESVEEDIESEVIDPIPTNDEVDGLEDDEFAEGEDILSLEDEDAETISVEIDGDVYEGDFAKGDEVVELELVDDIEGGFAEEEEFAGDEESLDLDLEDDLEGELDEEEDSLEISLDEEEEEEEEDPRLREVRNVIKSIVKETFKESKTVNEKKEVKRKKLLEKAEKPANKKVAKKSNKKITLEDRLVKRGIVPEKTDQKKKLNEGENKVIYDRLTELLNF